MSGPGFFAHQVFHAASPVLSVLSRPTEHAANMVAGNDIPGPEALFHLGVTGMIDERSMQEALLKHGISISVAGDQQTGLALGAFNWITEIWNQHYFSLQELPTVQEAFTLANRDQFTFGEMDRVLERKGFQSEAIRGKMENLRFEIPSSSDLVRFSVRHVFEPDLIKRLGYNDEFNRVLDVWHRFQGLNYPIFTGPFEQAINAYETSVGLPAGEFASKYFREDLEDPTWAQAFWWSHWVLPSPTQGYEMYFRYRPERDHRFDAPGTEKINFGLQDLELLLRANDYPPKFRPLLAGIAHRIPGLRFLRQLRATDVFDQNLVKELLLRQGYSDGDATVLAESVERNNKDQRRRAIEQQAKGQLAKYWELGVLDQEGYKALLIKHGLTPDDAEQSADLSNLDLQFKRVQKIVDFVRRQFLQGVISEDQAVGQLGQAGVVGERIGLYIEDWRLELQVKHKTISAQKAVKWACQGLISVDDLRNRLKNLGYLDKDIVPLVQEAVVCSEGLAARAIAQAARAARQQQRELQRTQRDAALAIVAARRQLASHGSPAQLRRWFCEGHIGELEVYSRLRFLGWPDMDITRMIGDCKSAVKPTAPTKPGG